MRVDKKRKGRGVLEVLQVVSSALAWGATEIHVLPTKFQLELNAEPSADTTTTLEDLLRLRNITAVRLTRDAPQDLQGLFALCSRKGYSLIRIFAKDLGRLFQWVGVPPDTTLMGVPVASTDQLSEGSVVFALSRVPFGPLSTADVLLKGEYYEG